MESELFGHDKGDLLVRLIPIVVVLKLPMSSTLFLDEIGNVPLELQPKLLRVLQEREIERLGG
ncbi:sigma 54-interacting transcriptional regulator [Shigella flexneri]